VRVPINKIRRILEDLDWQNSLASQRAPRREPVRVPYKEILYMLDHLDRQRAKDRARQKAGETEQIERPSTPNRLPRPIRETVQLQREPLKSILPYHEHESCFRDKKEASATRSWCKEVPLALQVDAAKSFYQAFTDKTTLPISYCVFCYRKQTPRELATF
ncbi:hypothetical protein BKA56DRAFT_714777, partial [Ilyonectria sp. MPI-CAGE-AT-0026]